MLLSTQIIWSGKTTMMFQHLLKNLLKTEFYYQLSRPEFNRKTSDLGNTIHCSILHICLCNGILGKCR